MVLIMHVSLDRVVCWVYMKRIAGFIRGMESFPLSKLTWKLSAPPQLLSSDLNVP